MDIFTWEQWRARGLSRHALVRELRSGAVRKVLRRVYAASDVPDTPVTRARAVSLIRPHRTVVGRECAAWLSGIDVLPPGRTMADVPVHLVVAKEVTPPRIIGCKPSQADLPDTDIVEEYGVERTSDARTALDLARFSARQPAVAAADMFLHDKRVTEAELWRRAGRLVKVRNCRLLRANLAAADAGAESYAESAQRVLFIDAGLPRPRTQTPLHGPAGDLIGFFDMGWRTYRVASEFDGADGHDSVEQREHDRRRRDRARAETGWVIDVVRKGELWGRPAALVAHTAGLLRDRGWRPPPAVLDQIVAAASFEADTGQRWSWMPLERLLAA
jgi:hypothetical protein